MVQLFHGGREQISSAPRAPAVAPSAIPSLRFKSEPRALTVAEIEELIAGYATAARLAAEGGVDGLEISMSHGYLPGQFLSPLSNRRGDGFDGSLEARMRFSVEVLQAVRAAAGPSVAIGARLSADELIPGGLGVKACAEIARRLQAAGLVDFISLVLGNSAEPAASTWIAPPPPARASPSPPPRRRSAPPSQGSDPAGHHARRHAGGRPAPDRRRHGRPRRDDPRADRRPRADPQVDRRASGRGDRVHRLQSVLYRPLPRRSADRVRRQRAHGSRADADRPLAGRIGVGDRRGSRRRRGRDRGGRCRRRGDARRARRRDRRPAAARRTGARARRDVGDLPPQHDGPAGGGRGIPAVRGGGRSRARGAL